MFDHIEMFTFTSTDWYTNLRSDLTLEILIIKYSNGRSDQMGKFNLILNDFCRKKNIELRERESERRSIREARRVCPPLPVSQKRFFIH